MLEERMKQLEKQVFTQMVEINLLTSRLDEPKKGIQSLETDDIGHRRPPNSIMDEESTNNALHRALRRSTRMATDRLDIDEKIIELESSSSEGCGVSEVTESRVTGGQDSLVGQWP